MNAPAPQSELCFESASEEDTARLGHALAECLCEGSVVSLCGPLGAGKTRLVQAVAEACGVDRRDVVSPTFVLIHEYQAVRPIYHLDAYRLAGAAEFEALGAPEYFAPPNLVFVEWADRVAAAMPEERLEITITIGEGDRRTFLVRAVGATYQDMLSALRTRLSAG